MNERQAYETVVAHQLVDDDKIKRTARSEPAKRPFAVRALKPVGIALAALLLVFGVTMAIPAARAEVLSWFRPESAQEYLIEDPETREPNEQLDALIVPAAESETHVEIRTADGEIFETVAEGLQTVELGETMFDGETLMIRMRVNGLGMLPAAERKIGGNLTRHVIPPENTPAYFEDYATPPEVLSGEIPFWAEAETYAVFTFADGTKLYSVGVDVRDWDLMPLVDEIEAEELENGIYTTPEQYAAINGRELAFLGETTVAAFIRADLTESDLPDDSGRTAYDVFRAHADENGRVSVTLGIEIWQDLGNGPERTVLDASLGTVTVDLDAYKSLKRTKLVPGSDPVTFAAEETLLTRTAWPADENGVPRYTIRNETINLEGLSFEPLEGGMIDARGIRDLRIRMTLPEGLKGFGPNDLRFIVLVDGERLGYADGAQKVQKDGSIVIKIDSVWGVPLDRLNGVQTVTLIPELTHTVGMRFPSEDGESFTDRPIEPGVPYTLDPDAACWVGETTEYPQYAIVFEAE